MVLKRVSIKKLLLLGIPGEPGQRGLPGQAGAKGARGEQGLKGDIGHMGLAGRPGDLGPPVRFYYLFIAFYLFLNMKFNSTLLSSIVPEN